MIVVDSSPLINLGKQGALFLLRKCFKSVIIPNHVYDEVADLRDSPEAVALGKAISEKWISIEKVTVDPFLHTKKLGQGEKEAISLAVKRKAVLLVDDDNAKAYASILGIEAHGTLYAIYIGYLKKFIGKEESINIFKGMIANGFYISTELYSRFLDLLENKNNP